METTGLEKSPRKHFDIVVDFYEDSHNPKVYCQDSSDPPNCRKQAGPATVFDSLPQMDIYPGETISVYTRGARGSSSQPDEIYEAGTTDLSKSKAQDSQKHLLSFSNAGSRPNLNRKFKDSYLTYLNGTSAGPTKLGEFATLEGLPRHDFLVKDLADKQANEFPTTWSRLLVVMPFRAVTNPSQEIRFDLLPANRR